MDRGTWQATVHGVAESDKTENTHKTVVIIMYGELYLSTLS